LKTPCKKWYDAFCIIPRIEGKQIDFIDFAEFMELISEIPEEFHTRLNDIDSLKPDLQLFSNPLGIEVTQQPFDLQMELCHL
jgi:hypothetical protein